jgi:hypothetical protein
MQRPKKNWYEPECPLAHALINKLSAMVGHCDLLRQEMPEDSPVVERIVLVQGLAKSMAADLAEFQCELIRLRTTNDGKPSIV